VQSIDLIRQNLKRSEEIVLSRVEDMRGYGLMPPTPKGGCHTVWVLGHLAYIESLIVEGIMQGRPNPRAEWGDLFDGAEVSDDGERFPAFDQILSACRSARASTIRLLDELTEDDLDRLSAQVPEGAEEFFGTYRSCLQYSSDHWLMHRGQLADSRRAAGLERAWY
jgi:uncharacterized damage-inducible protein DinB